MPKDFLLEGFEEKPKEVKPKRGSGSSIVAGDANENGGDGAAAKDTEEQPKKKPKISLLGAKALQYGIVYSTLRYRGGGEEAGRRWFI